MNSLNISFSSIMKLMLFVAFSFGSVLYFYGDLDNPKIPVFLPLIKDFLWIFFGGLILLSSLKSKIDSDLILVISVFAYLSIIILSKMILFSENNSFQYLIVIKNFFVYLIFGILLFGVFVKRLSTEELMNNLHAILLLTITFSLFLHFFYPVSSVSGRLWGTFGSPNGAGFIISSTVLFSYILFTREIMGVKKLLLTIFVCVPALLLTASLNSIISVILFIFSFHFFNFIAKRKISLKKTLFYIFSIILIFVISSFSISKILELSEIYLRIISILGQGVLNDAVSVRLLDFWKVVNMQCENNTYFSHAIGCNDSNYLRMDSTFLTFAYNLGWVNSILFLFSIYLPIVFFLFNKNKKLNGDFMPFIIFYFTVVPINLIFQHSFELFPSSIIYAAVIVLTLEELKRNQSIIYEN